MHSTTSSSNLSRVQELVAHLDQMKTTRVGARERLEFILDQGSELVQEFDFQDAFDLEHRAMSKRLAQLEDMDSTNRLARTQWENAPVPKDVREGASKLVGYLDGFVKEAKGTERKAEVEMLSQLWEWGPDQSWLYPWLTSGRRLPNKPQPVEVSEEILEFSDRKAALYREVKEEAEAHPHHSPCPVHPEPPADPDSTADEFVEKTPGASFTEFKAHLADVQEPPAEPKRFPLVSSGRHVETQPVGRVSTTKITVSVPAGVSAPGHAPEEEPDLIRRESWTAALREMTTDEWTFRRETTTTGFGSEGRTASVLLWHADQCETRLELTAVSDDQIKVGLRILLRGRLRQHIETLSCDEAARMHLDPVPFITKAVEAS